MTNRNAPMLMKPFPPLYRVYAYAWDCAPTSKPVNVEEKRAWTHQNFPEEISREDIDLYCAWIGDCVSCDRLPALAFVELDFHQCVCFSSKIALENLDDNAHYPWQDAFSEEKDTPLRNSMMGEVCARMGFIISSVGLCVNVCAFCFHKLSSTNYELSFASVHVDPWPMRFFHSWTFFPQVASKWLAATNSSWSTTFVKSSRVTPVAMGQAVVGRNISDQFSPGKMPSKIATLKFSEERYRCVNRDGKDRLLCGKCSLSTTQHGWKDLWTCVLGLPLEGVCSSSVSISIWMYQGAPKYMFRQR